jgi:drug/metabolite transporter superfamily protein YnfA
MFLPGDGPARLGSRFFAAFGGFFVDASFARGSSVSRFSPTAYTVGCILTPLPRLGDSRILVRVDRQILVLCINSGAEFWSNKISFPPKIQKN